MRTMKLSESTFTPTEKAMSKNDRPSPGVREIARWWPFIVLPALIAVAAGVWSASQQVPSYSASTRLEVLPLAQWDETFLGTSLVRDAGDPGLTAATTAALLDSRRTALSAQNLGDGSSHEEVAAAIKVSPVASTNVIEIVARATDAERAEQLSEGFAKAAMADRWRTISAELDGRIKAMTVAAADAPNDGEVSTRLQMLKVMRQSGSDPTLRISSTNAALRDEPMSIGLVAGLAAVTGLFIGLLAVFGFLRPRRSPHKAVSEPALHLGPTPTPAYSMNLER